MTTIAPPAEPIVVDAPAPETCPLTSKECTVDKCYNRNNEDAQTMCELC